MVHSILDLEDRAGHRDASVDATLESGIEHFAKTCCLSRSDWRTLPIGMLTVAFDASQDLRKKYLTVSGFIASAGDWVDFDVAWRKRLADDGLSCFHMVDFAQSNLAFKGWNEQENRRRSLLSDLLDIIQSHAYRKFGCTIIAEAYETGISPESKDFFAPNQLAMAGTLAGAEVLNWADSERITQKPRMVFEDGDYGKGKLMDKVKQLFGVSPDFQLKCDKPGIDAFTPLQAADILAYETTQILEKYGTQRFGERFRWPFKQLTAIPGEIRVLTAQAAETAEGMMKAYRYFSDNPLGGPVP